MESLIDAHKSEARAKLKARSMCDNIKFRQQQIVMLKILKKLQTGSEQKRLPVRVFKEKRTNHYALICPSGILHGCYQHNDVDPVPDALAMNHSHNLFTGIWAFNGEGIMKKVTLAKAFAAELDRPSVREMQKRGQKRPTTEVSRSESWSDFDFPNLPPLKEIQGAGAGRAVGEECRWNDYGRRG